MKRLALLALFATTASCNAVLGLSDPTIKPGEDASIVGDGEADSSVTFDSAVTLDGADTSTEDTGPVTDTAVAETDTGSCVPESDTAMCARLMAACGSLTKNDNCGTPRTVTSCGSCSTRLACSTSNTCRCTPMKKFCLGKDVYECDASGDSAALATTCSDPTPCKEGAGTACCDTGASCG